MKRIKKILQNFTLFDYVLVFLLLSGVVFFAFIFFRKQSLVTITVKISDENATWNSLGTKDWFSSLFYVGMKEKDGFGRPQAEVKNVFSYSTKPNRRDVYLMVDLRGIYTKSLNQYSYKGRPILVGYPIKLQLDSVNAEGIITSVGGSGELSRKTELLVEVRTWDDKLEAYIPSNFSDSTGVRPYVADAIEKNSVITDSNGEEIIRVLDKKVTDSTKVVTTDSGQVILQKNPLMKDVTLLLRIRAKEVQGKYYLFDEIPILVGEKLPLNFQNVSVFPDVTRITIDEK